MSGVLHGVVGLITERAVELETELLAVSRQHSVLLNRRVPQSQADHEHRSDELEEDLGTFQKVHLLVSGQAVPDFVHDLPKPLVFLH